MAEQSIELSDRLRMEPEKFTANQCCQWQFFLLRLSWRSFATSGKHRLGWQVDGRAPHAARSWPREDNEQQMASRAPPSPLPPPKGLESLRFTLRVE